MSEKIIPISPRQIRNRRIKVFGLTGLSTLLATLKWMTVIPSDASLLTAFLMIVLFMLTFGWIALFFWSSIFGFTELLRGRKIPGIIWPDPNRQPVSRTAILMPVYNESPQSVFANLLAMAKSLEKTGQQRFYDIFVLSDTTNPKVWIEEEETWMKTRQMMPADMNIYYRRRPINVARKSGNIEDFCQKWGAFYDFMIVLDADSLLTGQTMLTMTLLMETNKQTGIIQAPPMCINRNSLFARIQQFAGKVYGPIVSAGLAYWQVGDSNYWGHNAIIRVKAFMDCCKLPVLSGRAPFGGHILSHDFVEAALIRRGGWQAWLLPELKGSYEECPPSMIDFAIRDRRWCQGNMQHIKILFSKGLHPVSRIHFIIGIMSYLSSPLWLGFLLVGLSAALGRNIFPPEYFPTTYTLFPTWPIFDQIGVISLFVFSIFMLIFPKFLGLIIYLRQNKASEIGGVFGAIKSVLSEIIFSALSAPIMMMFQSKFVFDIFAGNDAGWKTQNRDETGTSLAEAWQRHCWHMILGIVTSLIVWKYAHGLFWWMLPITIGLILALPISMFSSREEYGIAARKHHYFIIPEEIKIPEILQEALKFRKMFAAEERQDSGVERVVKNSFLNALHILMLPVNGPAPDFGAKVFETAQIKLENYLQHNIKMELSREEEISLLYHPDVLKKANLMYLLETAA